MCTTALGCGSSLQLPMEPRLRTAVACCYWESAVACYSCYTGAACCDCDRQWPAATVISIGMLLLVNSSSMLSEAACVEAGKELEQHPCRRCRKQPYAGILLAFGCICISQLRQCCSAMKHMSCSIPLSCSALHPQGAVHGWEGLAVDRHHMLPSSCIITFAQLSRMTCMLIP